MTLEETLRQIVREEIGAAEERLRHEMRGAVGARPAAANRLLSLEDAAALTGYSPETLAKWARQGRIRRLGTPRAVRLSETELRAMLEKRDGGNKPARLTDNEILELARERLEKGNGKPCKTNSRQASGSAAKSSTSC